MDRTPAHPAASKPRIRMRGCGRGNGFTLVELLLAISGTMLVGLAVVSLMAATRYGTDSNQDLRALVARSQSLQARLTAAVRGAHGVAYLNDNVLAIWVEDVDEDDVNDYNEMKTFWFDPDSGTIRFIHIEYPPGGGFQLVGPTWARGVEAFSYTLDDDDPFEANLVTLRVTLSEGKHTETIVCTASIREGQ